jgi:hypothetical protein
MTADGATPLHCAANDGHVEAVKTPLQLSAEVEAKMANNSTPQHMAAFYSRVEKVGSEFIPLHGVRPPHAANDAQATLCRSSWSDARRACVLHTEKYDETTLCYTRRPCVDPTRAQATGPSLPQPSLAACNRRAETFKAPACCFLPSVKHPPCSNVEPEAARCRRGPCCERWRAVCLHSAHHPPSRVRLQRQCDEKSTTVTTYRLQPSNTPSLSSTLPMPRAPPSFREHCLNPREAPNAFTGVHLSPSAVTHTALWIAPSALPAVSIRPRLPFPHAPCPPD